MENKAVSSTIRICAVLVVIQVVRILFSQTLLKYVEKTAFTIDIVTMVTMIILTIIILIAARKLDIPLSFFPDIKTRKQKVLYACATAVVLILAVSMPVFTQDYSPGMILPILYSVIITPVFEEIIFRGYVWNALRGSGKSEIQTYLISTILFAVWHLGYSDVIWLKSTLPGSVIDSNLLFIMLMKVGVGLFFGVVVGFVRFRTKNTYAAILMHGVMNVFGR